MSAGQNFIKKQKKGALTQFEVYDWEREKNEAKKAFNDIFRWELTAI